jgi:Flp pilus assembly protein TadD
MLRKTTIGLAVVVLAICAGCQSHAKNKKAAQQRWQKASSNIKLALAQQHYDNGKFDEAGKLVKECISVDPEKPDAHLLLGKILLALDKGQEAMGRLRLAVELDDGLGEGWYWLGVSAQQLGRVEQAWSSYSRAMAISPNNVDYILAVAETYTARDQSAQAIELLEEKMKAMPRNVSLKVVAADLLCRTGRAERAVELYKQAILLADEGNSISESLGYCYVFGSKWDEAADIFNDLAEQCRAEKLSDEDVPTSAEDLQRERLYQKIAALCSMNSAQYDRAVSRYTELSIKERDNASLWVKLGQAALGAAMTDRALWCGQRAVSLRPGYPDAVALIGCAQYANGDYEAASENFEKIVADEKNGGFSWLMMARCYEQLGQTDRAERAYRKAKEVNPNSELGDFLSRHVRNEG